MPGKPPALQAAGRRSRIRRAGAITAGCASTLPICGTPTATSSARSSADDSGTMILGAVLAGGQSSRFGSDKALAELDGRTLIARAVDALAGWCEYVVAVGRET